MSRVEKSCIQRFSLRHGIAWNYLEFCSGRNRKKKDDSRIEAWRLRNASSLSEKVQLMFAAAIRCSVEKGENNDATHHYIQRVTGSYFHVDFAESFSKMTILHVVAVNVIASHIVLYSFLLNVLQASMHCSCACYQNWIIMIGMLLRDLAFMTWHLLDCALFVSSVFPFFFSFFLTCFFCIFLSWFFCLFLLFCKNKPTLLGQSFLLRKAAHIQMRWPLLHQPSGSCWWVQGPMEQPAPGFAAKLISVVWHQMQFLGLGEPLWQLLTQITRKHVPRRRGACLRAWRQTADDGHKLNIYFLASCLGHFTTLARWSRTYGFKMC